MKVVGTDVDHAGKPILTIGTRDTSVMIGTLTDLLIRDGGITATESLTGRVTGAITIGTRADIKPGVAATAKHSHS